jgi:catechol 2,3-dioxygenase-like lactoylglutathione lyase family enzyme
MPRPAALHHIAVQTFDLANSVAWYGDFFGCTRTWSTDKFSELSRARLPGLVRITEMVGDGMRFHLFERAGCAARKPFGNEVQFQHVCLTVDSADELPEWRLRWLELYDSGRYRHALPDLPTEVVVDDEGMHSFYCFDVNGLEFEFSSMPGGAR